MPFTQGEEVVVGEGLGGLGGGKHTCLNMHEFISLDKDMGNAKGASPERGEGLRHRHPFKNP